MWIFEIIAKEVIKIIRKRNTKKEPKELEKIECEHTFLPVDSTKKVLACSKCGMLIKSEELKTRIIDRVYKDERIDKRNKRD
jgi:hypothetical protein